MIPSYIRNYKFLLPFLMACILAAPAFSQRKILTASTKIVRVGYVDHSRLRSNFYAFAALIEKIELENRNNKKTFDLALEAINKKEKNQLNKDLVNGGSEHDKITSESAEQRTLLKKQYQDEQKRLIRERVQLFKAHDQKISEAIQHVISEKGLTDIKPLSKDSVSNHGSDITNLVLKHLNK